MWYAILTKDSFAGTTTCVLGFHKKNFNVCNFYK